MSKFSKSIKKTSIFENIKGKADNKNNFLLSKLRRLPVHRALKHHRKPIDFLIWPEGKALNVTEISGAQPQIDDFASLCNSNQLTRVTSFGTEKIAHALRQTSGLIVSTDAQSTANGLTA